MTPVDTGGMVMGSKKRGMQCDSKAWNQASKLQWVSFPYFLHLVSLRSLSSCAPKSKLSKGTKCYRVVVRVILKAKEH